MVAGETICGAGTAIGAGGGGDGLVAGVTPASSTGGDWGLSPQMRASNTASTSARGVAYLAREAAISLQRAKQLGLQGDFIGGQNKLATTLQIFPDNTEAKALVAEYKRREPEQREKLRLERLELATSLSKMRFVTTAMPTCSRVMSSKPPSRWIRFTPRFCMR